MFPSLLQQIKKRRMALGYKQKDMMLRIGISRQQYQSLESKGNPRLSTLELIAKGLNSELVLIPREKLNLVQAVLDAKDTEPTQAKQEKDLTEDPWQGLLGDEQ